MASVSTEHPVFAPPKTDKNDRTIPLPFAVESALLTHLATYPVGDDGLMFTNTYGTPLPRSGFNQMWARALNEAGVDHAAFHSLRHF